MTDIYELTCGTLASMGYPVVKQGSYGEGDALPDTYLTYFLVTSVNETHYDNKAASTTYRMRIVMYSRDPNVVQQADGIIRRVMTPLGFLRMGGRDLPTDPETGHEAFTVDYKYLDMEGF